MPGSLDDIYREVADDPKMPAELRAEARERLSINHMYAVSREFDAEADATPWWQWRRRRSARHNARVVALAGAMRGLGIRRLP